MASAVSNLSALRTTPLSAGNGNERFNDEAASWDSRPFVHEASRAAAAAILARLETCGITDTKAIDNLEIGCGTGILSFLLAPHFHTVVAVDAAEGMIAVLREKLSSRDEAPRNIVPVAVLLEDPEDKALPEAKDGGGRRMKFDLITSHLVLHHIPELDGVLETVLECLKPGGRVMLTDFQDFGPEARRFHPENKMKGVARHGINIEAMSKLMKDAGFINVDVSVGWTMPKMVTGKSGPEDESMQFPFVICYGEKSN